MDADGSGHLDRRDLEYYAEQERKRKEELKGARRRVANTVFASGRFNKAGKEHKEAGMKQRRKEERSRSPSPPATREKSPQAARPPSPPAARAPAVEPAAAAVSAGGAAEGAAGAEEGKV